MSAVLLAALLATACPVFADDVEDASEMLRSGQHQQALERVNKVLAAKPRDARARFLKGLIFAEQGNAKDATEVFLALTKDFPDLPEPYNNLAVIYASQGQYDKALQFDTANPAAKNKLALVRELVGGSAPVKAVAVAVAPTVSPVPVTPAVPTTPIAPATPKEATKAPVVVAAVEPAKPATEKPTAPKTGNAEILDTVNAWAKAWSAKSISVTVDAPKVSVGADGQASVTFRQGYRSDVVKAANTTKTLVLGRIDGRWLIQQERVGN